MRKRHHKKQVHEGSYVNEVDIELIDTDEGWSPYLSLDDVREALLREKLKADSRPQHLIQPNQPKDKNTPKYTSQHQK